MATTAGLWIGDSGGTASRIDWGEFFNALGSFGDDLRESRARTSDRVTAYMQNDVAKNQLEQLIRDDVLPATQ